MALSIPVPNSSYSDLEVSLGGKSYTFTFSFNDRDNKWRVDIYLQDTPIILSIKIVGGEALLSRYRLAGFDHGELFCARLLDDGLLVGRDNFGVDKPYEFLYLTNEEISGNLN